MAEDAEILVSSEQPAAPSKSGIFETFATLVKSMVGAGFLAIPYGTKNVGYLGAAVLIPLVSWVIELGIRLLVQTKRELKMRGYRPEELTFAGLGRILLGQIGFIMVLFTMGFAQLGTCIAYVIIVSETFYEFYDGIPKWGYAMMMLAVQTLLCQIRNIRNLQYTSIVGNVLVFLILVSIYGYNLNMLGNSGNKADIAWDLSLRHFPRCIGIIAFALEGITVVLPLEAAMKQPRFFMTILDSTLVGLAILLLTFGELGYMVFGDATEDMIIKNLPSNTFTTVIKATVMFNLIFTFPVQMFPVTEIIDAEVLSVGAKPSTATEQVKRSFVRLFCVLFCVFIAIILPNFGALLGVIGGFCFIFLGLLFPVLFFLILFEETLTSVKFWGLIFICVIGCVLSMLVTVNGVIDLVYGTG